jgi:hypothetical protein
MSETKLDAGAGRARRDALGRLCFLLHFAVMIYIVSGWLIANRGALGFYLVFLPAVVVQWRFNKNSCVLNNLESLLRSGRWRDATNREEGAWLLALIQDTLGLQIRHSLLDAAIYALMAVLWVLAFAHWRQMF